MTSTDKTLLAFTLVFVSSALWPILPNFTLIIAAFVLVCICIHLNISSLIGGAILGFIWAAIVGHWYIDWQIDQRHLNQNLIIEGVVSSIQHKSTDSDAGAVRFNLKLHRFGTSAVYHAPEVRLTWYRTVNIPKQGQTYRLLVKLKAPHGLANPNTFRYQTWLASKNIVATGYVIESESNRLLDKSISVRQHNIDRLYNFGLQNTAWLQALSFGFRGGFSDDDWMLLQKSGTAHLFAISGLHVGIVFSYAFFASLKLFAIGALAFRQRQFQIKKPALVLSALTCIFYGYLAGYEVPVSRAIIALLLWIYVTLVDAYWRLTSVLLYVITTFFILFPYSILGVSFWFSFIAVVSIWIFFWRFAQEQNSYEKTVPKKQAQVRRSRRLIHFIKQTLYLQAWLCVITLPLTAYVFDQVPIFALIANLVLVPWVSVVLVPLCLLATFSMFVGLPVYIYGTLYYLADEAMSLTLLTMSYVVELAAKIDIPEVKLDASAIIVLALMVLLAILPYWPLRKSILSLCLLVIASKLWIKHNSTPHLIVFDVGHGSAALFSFVDSNSNIQAWLFDTGARFPSGFSLADSVIIPNLEERGISRIDKVFLSHLDKDHAGGLEILDKQFDIDKVLSPANKCALERSKWLTIDNQQVSLDVIWPLQALSGEQNNHSCVVKLSIGQHTVLFAGDVEIQAERSILLHNLMHYRSTQSQSIDSQGAQQRTVSILRSDILIAPHHGSRTSSSEAFVQAVAPKVTVFSTDVQNRWGFPHPEVVKRYKALGSTTLITGEEGAIEFAFKSNQLNISTYRQDMYSRWYFKSAK